ncbi:MAG: hypothetical protein AB7O68_09790 [Pirellulales bacterium]
MLVGWVLAISAGGYAMLRYELTGRQPAARSGHWPYSTKLTREQQRATLVMFLHPQCPCSRASVAELTTLLTHCRDQVDVTVVFVRPEVFPPGWEVASLWRAVEALPVAMVVDPGGREAREFGAHTSGEVFLYDAQGALVFQGGITAGRGHQGDNPGRWAITAFLQHGTTNCPQTTVYGCPLFNS